MTTCYAWAAQDATTPLGPYTFQRRPVGPNDVKINITFCGVCHSDLHQVRNEWKGSIYPMVPGHEVIGTVTEVGANVKKVKIGDTAAVGCMTDSCKSCGQCKAGEEQYCGQGATMTYNGIERDGVTKAQGGYSNFIVVQESFTLLVPKNLSQAGAAPLLCAGITSYSPLKKWGVKAGDNVAIVGLGGLGHMGVKFAKALGAKVTVFTTSASKRESALQLGADDVALSTDPATFEAKAGAFSFILNTVAAKHDLNPYVSTLAPNGVMVLVGAPEEPHPPIVPFLLIGGRRSVAGSLIGGIKETQEMLDFCGAKNITCDVEVIKIQEVENAYKRLLKSDVKYRFVIDLASLETK